MLNMLEALVNLARKMRIVKDREKYRDIYLSVCKNIQRENELINYRIQWGIVLSTGVLATEGVVSTQFRLPSFNNTLLPCLVLDVLLLSFTFALSMIACFFSRKMMLGVNAALRQLDYVREKYIEFRTGRGNNIFQTFFELPRPFGDEEAHREGHEAARAFPKTMFSIWCIFVVIQFSAIIAFCSVLLFSAADGGVAGAAAYDLRGGVAKAIPDICIAA